MALTTGVEGSTMPSATKQNVITGGSATIYVSDLDRAVDFYVHTLGLTLEHRAGGHYAQLRAGDTLTVGLHPASREAPPPGAKGAITVGFMVGGDLDAVVDGLKKQGVRFTGPVRSDGPIRLALFEDPDGNPLYLAARPSGRS